MKEVENQSGEITLKLTKDERYKFLSRELGCRVSKSFLLEVFTRSANTINMKRLFKCQFLIN